MRAKTPTPSTMTLRPWFTVALCRRILDLQNLISITIISIIISVIIIISQKHVHIERALGQ